MLNVINLSSKTENPTHVWEINKACPALMITLINTTYTGDSLTSYSPVNYTAWCTRWLSVFVWNSAVWGEMWPCISQLTAQSGFCKRHFMINKSMSLIFKKNKTKTNKKQVHWWKSKRHVVGNFIKKTIFVCRFPVFPFVHHNQNVSKKDEDYNHSVTLQVQLSQLEGH